MVSFGVALIGIFSWQLTSLGATVKAIAATRSAAAYKKMSTFTCKTKNLAALCTSVKAFYKKSPTKFTEQAFVDSVCKKSLKQCALFSTNASYKAMSKKYLAKVPANSAAKTVETKNSNAGGFAQNTSVNSRPDSSNQPLDFPAVSDSSGSFFPDYDPGGRARMMDTPGGRYIEEQLADPKKKIDFFVNALVSGKDAGFLERYSNDNFTEKEILEIINGFRAYNGLSALSLNPKLVKAVENQAKYVDNVITARSVGGLPPPEETMHEQNSKDAFFTGKSATDRARYQGYENLPVAEGISFGRNTTFLGALYDLLYVPAHRTMFIDPYAKDIGFSLENDEDNNSIYSGLSTAESYKTAVINISMDYSQQLAIEDVIYPKNGTVLYAYDRSLAEAGYPFNNEGTDAVDANGTAFTIINYKTGIVRNTIKLRDMTAQRDLGLYLDVYDNSQVVMFRNAPRSPLSPGHEYQISYADKNGKLRTSTFSTVPDENAVEL